MAGFMLGNLSVEEMEKRLGVKFPRECVEFMNGCRQHEANKIGVGKWHCFDMPFVLVCGDMDVATKIHNHLKALEGFKAALQISIQQNN